MLTDNDIARIVGCIRDACSPIAIAVFGSYATGKAHAKSDLDVLVIRHDTQSRGARARAARRALFGILHPIDIQVFTPEEFEDTVHDEQSFTWIIVRQALIHHWTAEAALVVPSLFTMGKFVNGPIRSPSGADYPKRLPRNVHTEP